MSDNRGILAADVEGKMPEVFWPDENDPIFYRGSVVTIAGPSGKGKSLSTVLIGAHETRVGGFVIYCNAEDDEGMTKLRFEAAGADLQRIVFDDFNLWEESERNRLRAAISFYGATVVIFDTAAQHLDPAQSRWPHTLKAVRRICAEMGCTAFFVHHTNKNVKKGADWRSAIGGTTGGLVGTSRNVALFGSAPDVPDTVLLCPVKDSYRETPKAVRFEFRTTEIEFDDTGDTVDVGYLGIAEKGVSVPNPVALVFIQSDEKRGPSPERAQEAGKFICGVLADGAVPVKDCYLCASCGHQSYKRVTANQGACPECDGVVTEVKGIETHADEAGISWGTLKRIKGDFGVESGVKGFGPGKLGWWRLPDGHIKLNPGAVQDLP